MLTQGKIINGLHLYYDDFSIDTQYQMTIHKDFRGFTYRKLVNDKVVYCKRVYTGNDYVNSLDYSTAFVFLRSHFNL
jgi:hypothetical protein